MDIEKQIEALVTAVTQHESDIQALARVATAQEAKVSRLDEAMASLAVSMTTLAEEGRETRHMLADLANKPTSVTRKRNRSVYPSISERDRRIHPPRFAEP